MVARMYVEPLVKPMFYDDSYGYRPNKSALDAIAVTRKRCWKYDYVIELDVKGLFDNIDHELLMKVVQWHVFVLLNDKSRMKGDFHVRFCEKFEVQVLLLTRLRGGR